MDGQPLLVTFVLPLLLALLGILSAVLVVTVPKLLERRTTREPAPAGPASPFPDDDPVSVDHSEDVPVLLRAVDALVTDLDEQRRETSRWRRRALDCEGRR